MSSPPDSVLPDGGMTILYARASLVMESSSMTNVLCLDKASGPAQNQLGNSYMIVRQLVKCRIIDI